MVMPNSVKIGRAVWWLPALLALGACGRRQAPPSSRVPVSVARVVQRDVPFDFDAAGTVEPLSTVDVYPQVGGMLMRVHFQEGDEVREGQVLFEIDPRPFEAAVQQAEAALYRDLVTAANAQREALRYHDLLASRSVSDEEYQTYEATAQASAATVRADSAALSSARLNLGYATVRAPVSGRTGNLNVKEGNLVRTTGTTPLVTINQLRPILVRFAVPSALLPEVQRRASAQLAVYAGAPSDSAPPSRGVLSFIDNHVDSATGTVKLKGRFANADERLWPGEFVNVRLVLGVDRNATVIPSQAVVSGQQGSFVFTVTGDSVQQRPVTVARSTDSIAVIAAGLAPGAVVVTDGQIRLTARSRVDIKSGPGAEPPPASGGRIPAGGSR